MIEKYAALEAKALMRTHAQMLFNWASTEATHITPGLREALMASCMRIFEVIEELPMVKETGITNCEGDKLNG